MSSILKQYLASHGGKSLHDDQIQLLGLVSKCSYDCAKKASVATNTAIKPPPPISLKVAIERFATKSVANVDQPWQYCLMYAILHVAPFRAKVLQATTVNGDGLSNISTRDRIWSISSGVDKSKSLGAINDRKIQIPAEMAKLFEQHYKAGDHLIPLTVSHKRRVKEFGSTMKAISATLVGEPVSASVWREIACTNHYNQPKPLTSEQLQMVAEAMGHSVATSLTYQSYQISPDAVIPCCLIESAPKIRPQIKIRRNQKQEQLVEAFPAIEICDKPKKIWVDQPLKQKLVEEAFATIEIDDTISEPEPKVVQNYLKSRKIKRSQPKTKPQVVIDQQDGLYQLTINYKNLSKEQYQKILNLLEF